MIADSLFAVAVFAMGCLFGSWLFWRGRTNSSPLPTLPKKPVVSEDDKPTPFVRVKP